MTKLPVITQNFSSPDVFSDTPLMLLPQSTTPPLPDRDQEGFSQLILHDLHRHRHSYLRSYTAFETLKKRQDFVLRQENLRNLQFYEQRLAAKQEQFIDQSIHSYEQCFVKVINGNLNLNTTNLNESHKRSKTMSPSFDKFHPHQLSHIPAMPLDPPPVTPFHRYQRTHRPPKYRSQASLYRSAQSLHEAFHSSSFSQQSQPFVSFTESYLQKYTDQSMANVEFDESQEQERKQIRAASTEPICQSNQTKKQEPKSKTSDLQHNRANMASRNTNTPSSTPQMSYNDAVRDGLTSNKENEKRLSSNNEKRRSSQQSTSQLSSAGSKSNTKRPKSGKKKQVIINMTKDKKSDTSIETNDILKSAMFVQNYESNTNTSTVNPSTKIIERTQSLTNVIRKSPSLINRSSIKSNEDLLELRKNLETTSTPIVTSVSTTDRPEVSVVTNQTQEEVPATNVSNVNETKRDLNANLQQHLELVDNRKRIKKGAFDSSNSMQDLVAFELGMMRKKKTHFQLGKDTEDGNEIIPENQATLDLLEKIRQSATGLAIGQAPVSQQACRFELPYDLKLLESLTPLDYLTKYCRLSARRNYQFKRLFDKYRNSQYRFESTNLYTAIVDIHSETFTRSQYEHLCQLIDIVNEQHQFTYETFAGILALSERVLFESSKFRSGFDERDLAKDTIEKCDFDSLDRKLDGLIIGEKMKRLLAAI